MIIEILLILACFSLAVTTKIWYTKAKEFEKQTETKESDIKTLENKKRSLEVKYGQLSEKLVPFLEPLKSYNQDIHFLGNPIDYVAFGEDDILFLEVKSGDARLSKKQKNIKKLIEEKKVRFLEIRIDR